MRTPRETFSRSGRVRGVLILAMVLSALMMMGASVVACGGSSTTTTAAGSPSTTASAPSSTGGGGSVQVLIKNFAFDPDPVTVKAGESVTWTNRDSAIHHLVGDQGEFDSGDMAAAGTFTFTPKTAGTIIYHCSIHPSMNGTITVQ